MEKKPKFRDISYELELLKDRIYDIIQRQDYSKKDVRHVVLSNCRGLTMNTAITLNGISAFEEGKITPSNFKMIFGPNIEDGAKVFKVVSQYTGMSFLTFYLFRIENYVRIMLSQLQEEKPPEDFYIIVKELFKKIEIRKRERKITILQIATMIRNSLHSDGLYLKKNKTLRVDGVDFKFIKGQSTLIGFNWMKMLFLAKEIITIIEELNDCKEIKNIPDPIPFIYQPK